jgi:hypothetical protein
VTLCAAALFSISDGSIGVLGVSDRMLTVPPDIQYEPHGQQKIYYLTNSIQIMTAGDSGLQADILSEVRKEAYRRIDDDERWLAVKEIAELYAETYLAERQVRANREVLRPLGLDFESWIDRQLELDSGLVTAIAKELYSYRTPSVSAIVAGVDPTGPHIYVISNSDVTCHDKVGFAAIGVGANHAGSEFMFAGHSRYKLYPETLLLTHRAKKRAESAPGVGKETDMFFVGPPLGTFTELRKSMIEYLDSIFAQNEERKRELNERADDEINKFFEELRAQYQNEAQEQEKGSIGDDGEPLDSTENGNESQGNGSEDGESPPN